MQMRFEKELGGSIGRICGCVSSCLLLTGWKKELGGSIGRISGCVPSCLFWGKLTWSGMNVKLVIGCPKMIQQMSLRFIHYFGIKASMYIKVFVLLFLTG